MVNSLIKLIKTRIALESNANEYPAPTSNKCNIPVTNHSNWPALIRHSISMASGYNKWV